MENMTLHFDISLENKSPSKGSLRTLIVFINQKSGVFISYTLFLKVFTIYCLLYCLGSIGNDHQRIAEDSIMCVRLSRG